MFVDINPSLVKSQLGLCSLICIRLTGEGRRSIKRNKNKMVLYLVYSEVGALAMYCVYEFRGIDC